MKENVQNVIGSILFNFTDLLASCYGVNPVNIEGNIDINSWNILLSTTDTPRHNSSQLEDFSFN